MMYFDYVPVQKKKEAIYEVSWKLGKAGRGQDLNIKVQNVDYTQRNIVSPGKFSEMKSHGKSKRNHTFRLEEREKDC